YGSFFGHTDQVAKFYGIPYAEESHGDDHGEAKADDHGDDHGKAKEEHHYMFAGEPGQGAIYIGEGNTVLDDAHKVPYWVKTSPFAAMLIGFLFAYWFYIKNPELPKRLAENQRPLYLFLKNKWYFDELYNVVFVQSAIWIGKKLWKKGDGNVIDGTINGVSMGIVPFFTRLAGRAQSGYIFTYAFAMVIGIAVLVTWMTLSGGAN
ncbi:NADH-quinone oxidoreductase subunit L, partial [Synechococcus sp. MU1644]|nr:NADH-quinone oxidoreductase subunit L [Synechococcus sp. MU1644]